MFAALSLLLCLTTIGFWILSYIRAADITYISTTNAVRENFIRSNLGVICFGEHVGKNSLLPTGFGITTYPPDATLIPPVRIWLGGSGIGHLGLQRYYNSLRNVFAVQVPYWLVAIIFWALPSAWITRRLLGRPKDNTNLCPNCGYDLRATPDRCPECGTVATKMTPR